jgi:hypothetical protein
VTIKSAATAQQMAVHGQALPPNLGLEQLIRRHQLT